LRTPEVSQTPFWKEGDVIHGLYDVRGVIGAGNFGTVYRAYHLNWRRDLAVKRPSESTLANRHYLDACLDGARRWAELGLHPGVVTCFYVREIEGVPGIFMEYAAGGSLREKLAAGVTFKEALGYAIQLCAAMAHAHGRGVVHGDLKPENCLFAREGSLKVADFGLGSVEEFAGDADALVKALRYVAPERWGLTGSLTREADIFSFGVILQELVGEGREEVGDGVEEGDASQSAATPRQQADVPPLLSALIGECLSPSPNERPESFRVLGDRLREMYPELAGGPYQRGGVENGSLQIADLNRRGLALFDIDRKDEALAAIEDAVRGDPSHLESGYNHTLLLWERGRMTDREVVRWLEMKAESHAGEWRPIYLLGLAHIARRDPASADSVLSEAFKTASADGKVKAALEEVEKARDAWPHILLTLKGHEDVATSAAICPHSRYAISGGEDRSLRYWDLITGECLRTYKGHERPVRCVALSPDGRFALSGSDDRTLRYWDVATGECVRTLKGHERAVNCAAVSPDGRFGVSGGDDRTVRLWDLGTGECLRTLKGHDRSVRCVAVSSTGNLVVSGSDDRTLRCWDVTTGECLRTLRGHERAVRSVALSSDGRTALSGSDDRSLCRWDLDSGECCMTLKAHEDGVGGVALSGNDRFAVSQGADKTLRLWDLSTGACMRTIDRRSRSVGCLALSPDGRFVLSGRDDNELGLWYLGDLQSLRLPLVTGEAARDEAALIHKNDFSALKERVVECMRGRNWRGAAEYVHRARAFPGYERHPEVMDLWHEIGLKGVRKSFHSCWLKGVLRGHGDWVNCAVVCPGGRTAVSGGDDRTVRLWDLGEGENIRVLEGHEDSVSSLAVSPVGGLALSGSHDGTLRLWDLMAGEGLGILGRHDGWVSCVAISPDGRFALSGGDDGALRLWDLKMGQSRGAIEGPRSGVRALAVSPDGSLALVSGDDAVAYLWDLESSTRLRALEGHESWISSVAISADGRYAVSGGLDCALRLWDLRDGSCLGVLRGHGDWVRSVTVSPDGRFALSGGHDRSLRLWDLRTGECLQVMKGHDEWVGCVAWSPDGRYALSGGHDATLRLWEFDWGYEFPTEIDWAEAASPYLDSFLTLHTPVGPEGLARQGTPTWTEEHFAELLHSLSLHGYGWLTPDGVLRKLNALAAARAEGGVASIAGGAVPGPVPGLDERAEGMHCFCCGKRFAAGTLSSAGFCPECQAYVGRRRDADEQGSWWKKLTGRQARPWERV